MTDYQKDEIVNKAQEVSKYAFMLAFAIGFPNDQALIAHNRENLKISTNELLKLVNEGVNDE